ncbi:DM13 domain-containing protein [Anaerolineales bacterium HSG24]|nr:DM13 domain-containing protein [Anaerolineales bacterium HSG24]
MDYFRLFAKIIHLHPKMNHAGISMIKAIMSTRRNRMLAVVVIGQGLIICTLFGLVIWYFVSVLLYPPDQAVENVLPFELPNMAELEAMSEEERANLTAKVMATAAVMPTKKMNDSIPEAESELVVVSKGAFVGQNASHLDSGTVIIYRLPGGEHLLRFEQFDVTNGPDLHVILTSHPAPTTSAELHETYIDLGPLKGSVGNQNYTIPGGVQLEPYQSVVIYCKPFQVIFATARIE